MKLHELLDAVKQLKNPQSSGSRGIKLNKTKPQKRYFDINKKPQLTRKY